jgi:polyhydroxybutyrate depolymerase
MFLEQHRSLLARSVAAAPVIALFVVTTGSCSEDSQSEGTGGSGIGGVATGGGGGKASAGATGGASMGTGGTLQSTGGAPLATGGTATASGGTSTGGSATGGASTGGASVTGGTSAATGGSDGGTPNLGGAAGGAGTTPGGVGGAGGAGGGGGASAGSGGSAGASTRSPGCGKTTARPNRRTQQTMQIAGATRYYLLDVPENDGQTPLTLVFGLHGYDMNNVAVVDLYNFTSRSNGKAITVLPQGEGPPPGDTSHWGDMVLKSRWEANEANYEFIQSLKTDIAERYCVDTSRTFITGFSMGGFFTNGLACAHHDWFRGFAPVAGGGPTACSNAEAKPAIMIHHGTADDIVELESGEGSRDFWLEHNGCAESSKSSFTGCTSYDGCPDGKPVVWCVGNWNHTISAQASANIWSFFDGLE